MTMRLWAWRGMLLAMAWSCSGPTTPRNRELAKIQVDIALTELNKGRLREALRELLTAVKADPDNPNAHNALGLVYHTLAHKDEALTHYQKAVALKADFSEAHNNLGVLLLDLGRYDDAIEHFRTALADILYPTPSFAEGNMGWAFFKNGKEKIGVQHLRNAVATNPKFCRGYEWLVRIGLETGNSEMTVNNCGRFEKHCLDDDVIAPTIPVSYVHEMKYYCGLGLLKAGQREAARKTFAACADPKGGDFARRCTESLAGLK